MVSTLGIFTLGVAVLLVWLLIGIGVIHGVRKLYEWKHEDFELVATANWDIATFFLLLTWPVFVIITVPMTLLGKL